MEGWRGRAGNGRRRSAAAAEAEAEAEEGAEQHGRRGTEEERRHTRGDARHRLRIYDAPSDATSRICPRPSLHSC
jgi:hypothetical protein